MENIQLYCCMCFSCFVEYSILCGFMDARYKRLYRSKNVYILTGVIVIVSVSAINLLGHIPVNFVTWIVVVAMSAIFLFYDDGNRPVRRVLESEVFLFVLAMCETLGVVILDWILWICHIHIQMENLQTCLEIIFSKVVIICLYQISIGKLTKKRSMAYTKIQYILDFVIILYTLINIIIVAESMNNRSGNNLLIINLGCIVLANMFLLFLVKIINEKSYLEYELKILEKQADVQYQYYLSQKQKYSQTLQILHDVDKHLKSLEQLYIKGDNENARVYTSQIEGKLKRLIPIAYTGNSILDIILSDKAEIISQNGIELDVKIDYADLDFMAAIDVTTIFGNLLDNSIEACMSMEKGKRKISVRIGVFHEMILIRVENSSKNVKWKNDMPVSEKGQGRGIGLLNVQRSVSNYDGEMKLKNERGLFIVDILLNEQK